MKKINKKHLFALKKYIQVVATDKNGTTGPLMVRFFLRALSLIYGRLVSLHAYLYKQHFFESKALPCKTISVGNLTAGGTGKTPFTIYLAKILENFGLRVVIASRGYTGAMEKNGGIVSDGITCTETVDRAGDEPYLISQLLKTTPIVVGKNKFKIGLKAIQAFNPDIIIFDDAFQHFRVKHDLDLVLVDSLFPFGNGFMLPRGTLRESPSALKRADAIILTRNTGKATKLNLDNFCPIFPCSNKIVLRKIVSTTSKKQNILLKNKAIIIFSGLANNSQFSEAMTQIGFSIKGTLHFYDHHKYTTNDIKKIIRLQKQTGVELIATTDKDYVKLENKFSFPNPLLVFGIEMKFTNNEKDFTTFISNFVLK